MPQMIPLSRGPLFQLAEQLFGDLFQLVLVQRMEHHDLVQPSQQFGTEISLCLGQHRPAHRLLPGGLGRKAQAALVLGQMPGPQIAGENEDGVGKIGAAARRIGEGPFLHDLQKQVLDIPVGLLDLVQQHDGIGPPPHRFGELASLVVADIPRRRPQQAADAVGLHIFAHIKPQQSLFAAEPAFGQSPGQLGFAHPGGSQKQQRPHRSPRFSQPGAGPAHCPRHGFHRLLLPHHPVS